MAKTNVATRNTRATHEGGPALPAGGAERQLRRAVASCLLWEDGFYEDGEEIATRIKTLVAQCSASFVADLAVEARAVFKLRHAPLWLMACLASKDRKPLPGLDGKVAAVLRRADEPAELLALYAKAWPDALRTEGELKVGLRVPAAFKRGIATALNRFDAYQLAKYDRAGAFTLRDVARLTHPKADTPEQSLLFKQLIAGELPSPDTWEVELSAGGDKKAVFTRLLQENKLGYMALLRNLRNMATAGVDADLVRNAITARKGAHNVLPFRYVAAARAAPQFEPYLDEALCTAIEDVPVMLGETIVLVDVSGSMTSKLSAKSDLRRIDAAATLASILPGKCRVFSFASNLRELPPRKGMAGIDGLTALVGGGTHLGAAVNYVNALPHDRLIVITDEESYDPVPAPKAANAYMINVAQAKHEVGYGKWTRVAGFSENVLRYIAEHERQEAE